MSLQEEIARIKAELEQAEKGEAVPEQEDIEEAPELEEPTKEEPEEPAKEEPKEDPEPEEPTDNAGWARLRREKAAAERRAEQEAAEKERLLAQLNELKNGGEQQEQPAYPAQMLERIIQDKQRDDAAREFMQYESKVKRLAPDYDAVSSEYVQARFNAMRLEHPRKSDSELSEMVQQAILLKAAEYARAGFENPVEELYHEAKELGFGKKKPEPAPEKEDVLKPDLRKVAENKKRSTGMAANRGEENQGMSRQYIEQNGMPTAAEWAKLSAEQKRQLIYG